MAAAFFVAAALPALAGAATVMFAPPAGSMPAGRYHGLPFDAVLPSGRLVTPAGTSVVTGTRALGVALTPDGRFAIVSNGDALGDSELDVVDTATMTVATRYHALHESFYVGVAAVADPLDPSRTLVLAAGGTTNAVYAFSLAADGALVPGVPHVIPIPGPSDPGFADAGLSVPSAITIAPDGRHAYVADEIGGSVATIDLTTRALTGTPRAAGFFPAGVALAGSRLLVTNEGLMRYGVLPAATPAPPFQSVAADPQRASSLSFYDLDAAGTPSASQSIPMDASPDGVRIVGGAHPSAIVATHDGRYAFVAMTNVDRIATVDLSGIPYVAGGTELRLFDRGPYGTQPCALALSRDGSRLYVALGGLNAIAIVDARDPLHLHRLGLIPTGWAPTALALSADDRTLFITNSNGFGSDGASVPSTLQRVDLANVHLADATRATLAATRDVVSLQPVYPHALRNVVLIVEDHQSFDGTLGDLGYGPADAALVQLGESVTPNLHALARRYAVAGNMFADTAHGLSGHDFIASGMTTAYTARTRALAGTLGAFDAFQDPEDAPRLGSIFDALARHGLSFRDYGEFVHVSGYRAAAPAGLGTTPGLGGWYGLDVPAPAALADHVDVHYPGWNPAIPDTDRAAEFIRDYGTLVDAHRQPRFAYVWLPGSGARASAADSDRALGAIVGAISHSPAWRSTAIVIVPADATGAPDHVAASRTFAVVVSPHAKRRFIGMRHLSSSSVLKTLDELFDLPPLSLGDLLAGDMSGFFTQVADLRPFQPVDAPAP
jgi:DNA-binding beta-propeller fold protein YncE